MHGMYGDSGKPKLRPRPWYSEFLCAGTAAVAAIVVVNPFDVVKTRMMIQGQLGRAATPYSGIVSALVQIGRADGLRGLQAGLSPSSCWQFSNVSCRFGVYALAKKHLSIQDEKSHILRWFKSIFLAGGAGAVGAFVSNPFFIIKTRIQATSSDPTLAVGEQHAKVQGLRGALIDIYRADGFRGFTRGLSSFTLRVVAASSSQLSTKDAAHDAMVRLGMDATWRSTEVCSAMAAGVAMAVAMQPFDFACTRLANSRTTAELGKGDAAATFSGPIDVIRKTIKTEGLHGVFRGLPANYVRIAPYNVLVFFFAAELRKLETSWRTIR